MTLISKFNLMKLRISSSLEKIPLCKEQKPEVFQNSGFPQSQHPEITFLNDNV